MYSNVKSIFLPYSANYINRVNMAGKLLSVNAISLDVHEERPACRWSWHLSPPLPVVIFNSGCPRFWLMLNLFLKNLAEKFGAKEKVLTFAVPSETHWFHEHGSLAQLVQSVCLTSRGSGVRLPQLPPQRTRRFSGSFFCFPVIHGVQLWPLSLCSEEETSDNEQVYFHIGKSN